MIPHWSFNAARPEQPEFEERLQTSLQSYYDAKVENDSLWYAEYPNFWRGFLTDSDVLQNGTMRITRSQDTHGHWTYVSDQVHESSGEYLHTEFQTLNDSSRTIQQEWRVIATNETNGSYDRYSSVYRIENEASDSGGQRLLISEVNGKTLRVRGPRSEAPVTGWHSLFDAIPVMTNEFGADHPDAELIVLDEMTTPIGPCRIRHIGSVDFAPAGRIEGVCLYGTGCPPSYWWMDSARQIVIVATTWRTFVAAPAGDEFPGGLA